MVTSAGLLGPVPVGHCVSVSMHPETMSLRPQARWSAPWPSPGMRPCR